MNYIDTLDQVKLYVISLFNSEPSLPYHNLSHTEEVVANAVKMANYYQLADQDIFVLMCACWFHDVGYLKGHINHENLSADAARAFLTKLNIADAVIQEVVSCIDATKMPQQPQGLLQQIICDADLHHLATSRFKEKSKALREELGAFCNQPSSKEEWRKGNISFFQKHHFHTDYGNKLLNKGKAENLAGLIKKANQESGKAQELKKEIPAKMKAEKKEKADRLEKGIQTMFRVASNNHQRLSDMADNKAHIMISTNSIILSVILSILLRKLEDNPHLILPTLILLIICVVAMVFSILATRPAIPAGTFTPQDLAEKKVNLLFFGNFYNMKYDDYEKGMQELMEDNDFLYDNLIKDLHSQGVVLGRKYRLLRIAYNVFMYGIVAAVFSFIVAMAWIAF